MLPVIADEHAFQHQRHRVEIYGVCRDCRQRDLRRPARMSETAGLGLFVAFVAGLLSFLSPCVLPLVPSYVGFLTGMTLPEMVRRRRMALLHALCFVAGFSLIFILLGASATALGRALNYYQVWLHAWGGVLIIVFGPGLPGRPQAGCAAGSAGCTWSTSRSAFSGRCWSAWRSGPAGRPASGRARRDTRPRDRGTDVARGMLLLAAYSAGLAVPFLIAALAVESFLDWFQRFRRYLPWVMRVSGVLLSSWAC